MTQFVCALTGEEADDRDVLENDEFDGMPIGWTRVTVERRIVNPRYLQIVQGKRMLVQAALSQMPEEARSAMAPLVSMQIDAQFASLVELTPEYEIEREVVYVSDPADNTVLAREWNDMRDSFGLAPVEIARDDENENEDDTDEEEG
jgi:hypothetical protein